MYKLDKPVFCATRVGCIARLRCCVVVRCASNLARVACVWMWLFSDAGRPVLLWVLVLLVSGVLLVGPYCRGLGVYLTGSSCLLTWKLVEDYHLSLRNPFLGVYK